MPNITIYVNIAPSAEILRSGKYGQPAQDKCSWPYLRNTVLFWSYSGMVLSSKIWRREVWKYGQPPFWTNTVDHIWEILCMFCFDLILAWCSHLRYEGGRSSWGVKAFWPRFQFVKYWRPNLRNTKWGKVLWRYVLFWSHSQMASKIWRREFLGCKSILATFPICPNWLWGVIHWTRTHTEETNKEGQRKFGTF